MISNYLCWNPANLGFEAVQDLSANGFAVLDELRNQDRRQSDSFQRSVAVRASVADHVDQQTPPFVGWTKGGVGQRVIQRHRHHAGTKQTEANSSRGNVASRRRDRRLSSEIAQSAEGAVG